MISTAKPLSPSRLLAQIEHRPWPLPAGRWSMTQSWHDLLFAHWPLPVDVLRPLLPPSLEIDTFEGEAWLGVIPFGMRNVRARYTPALPWFSAFPELNVRTYVTLGGKPGVFFFGLEAANPIAVRAARRWFYLPYFDARMTIGYDENTVAYSSHRTHHNSPPAEFSGRYHPNSKIEPATRGTIEYWLTERYCLYAERKDGSLFRGEIHHTPWPLQRAEAEINTNSMASAAQIELPDTPPLLHFSENLDVLVWPLTPV